MGQEFRRNINVLTKNQITKGRAVKEIKPNIRILLVLLLVSFFASEGQAVAQSMTPIKQETLSDENPLRIAYHGEWIITFTPDVFFIWYGCWDDNCGQAGDSNTRLILEDYIENLGGTPYFQMNAFYPDYSGHTPSGALLHAGSIGDRYSHGTDLTASDIQEIVADAITDNRLPQDPGGIYVVLASADVNRLRLASAFLLLTRIRSRSGVRRFV
jgi:hypothetical protein